MSNWFCVYVHSEMKAAANLERQGYEIYFPKYRKQRRHAGRTETVERALFPRYLFVAIDLHTQRWRNINSTIGVHHLLCNGDGPIPVPSNFITELKSREAGGFIEMKIPPIPPGSKVRVVGGEFEDFVGRVESVGKRERVAILLDILGREARVTLPAADLIAAA